MKNFLFRLVQSIILFSFQVYISAQDINISYKTENIQIINDSLFNRNVTVLINQSSDKSFYPVFYDYELEKISEIKVYRKKGERFKLLKNPVIQSKDVDLDLSSSKRVLAINIPTGTEVKLSYKISCNELRYFTDLWFFTYFNIDTLNYQISVPEEYQFFYDELYTDSLKYIHVDSSKSGIQTIWNFEAIPVKIKPDLLKYFGIYRDLEIPIVRTALVPSDFMNRNEFLNNWYLGEVENTRGLDSAARTKIDEITEGLTDTSTIISVLYDYVRTNFKYVAVEIGMGAFIPSHVNEVFINKQGDCKDLSNFLCEALNYKGIKSDIALASTFHHICDCDFPSLCSANHVVCVVYLNNKPVVLDPTDPIHVPGNPVQSIQERTILIINSNGGEYYKIGKFPPQKNRITCDIEINADSGKVISEGEFRISYTGISGNSLKWLFYGRSEEEKIDLAKKYYERVFNNQSISGIEIEDFCDTIKVTGNLSVDVKIFKDKDEWYLFPDFLPHLIDYGGQETLMEGTYTGNTVDKRVSLRITMAESFKAFEPIEHSFSGKGISLDMKISSPVASVLEIDYEFVLDHIFIKKENINTINDILKSYKKIINEPIVLKNKD